jgi:hypothetical protein
MKSLVISITPTAIASELERGESVLEEEGCHIFLVRGLIQKVHQIVR